MDILGYRDCGDHYEPIVQPSDLFYTQAFVVCHACDRLISAVGGPIPHALCLDCYSSEESLDNIRSE